MAKDGTRKFELIKDTKFGVEVQIYVDKDLNFSAHYADRNFKSKTAADVVADVRQAIEDNSNLQWQPVIEIAYTHPEGKLNRLPDDLYDQEAAKFSINVERYYVAQKPDGTWSYVTWRAEPEHRLLNAKSWHSEVPSHRVNRVGGESYSILPYTPELWEGFLQLIEATLNLQQRVTDLIQSDQGVALLANVGAQKLLMLSVGNESEDHLLPDGNGDDQPVPPTLMPHFFTIDPDYQAYLEATRPDLFTESKNHNDPV